MTPFCESMISATRNVFLRRITQRAACLASISISAILRLKQISVVEQVGRQPPADPAKDRSLAISTHQPGDTIQSCGISPLRFLAPSQEGGILGRNHF